MKLEAWSLCTSKGEFLAAVCSDCAEPHIYSSHAPIPLLLCRWDYELHITIIAPNGEFLWFGEPDKDYEDYLKTKQVSADLITRAVIVSVQERTSSPSRRNTPTNVTLNLATDRMIQQHNL